jgi:hypothetical protein
MISLFIKEWNPKAFSPSGGEPKDHGICAEAAPAR